ncbi:MAG: serine/threonine protein kinase [Nitrococcus mobilis]|nr:serine/threonine protein kinase [Nitrococcus mobilis]
MDPSPHPYAALVPEIVLTAVEALGVTSNGRLLALNSYENRVYQVGLDDAEPLVVKFYRPGRWSDQAILEEHAFAAELVRHEIPVVAPLSFAGATLHYHQGFRYAVFPRRGGRSPELDDPDCRVRLGRFLGRIHAVGASRPFVHRPTLRIADYGEAPCRYLLEQGFIPAHLVSAYETLSRDLLAAIRRCYARVGELGQLRLHGDCHLGNILWTEAGPHFVDLDDCLCGPAIQDLWMLLSGSRAEMILQLSDLLAGYEDFYELDRRELVVVEALRTLRMMNYSAWLARRWSDPAFPLAFPWFGSDRYWEEHVLALREQAAALDEPPLVA